MPSKNWWTTEIKVITDRPPSAHQSLAYLLVQAEHGEAEVIHNTTRPATVEEIDDIFWLKEDDD